MPSSPLRSLETAAVRRPTRGKWVRLLPLEPAPFALCLLLAEDPEAGSGPFLREAPGDGATRDYAAVLVSDSGAVLDRLVLTLPGEDPEEALFPGEEPPPNPAVEAAWEDARRDLVRLLEAPQCFPELALPDDGGAAPRLLPPTLLCAVSGRLCRIPCPRCLGALATCRDDALLAAAGLPLFGATSARFLSCPACHAGEGAGQGGVAPRFYAESAAEARGLERVGSWDELRREIAGALAAAGADGPSLPAAAPDGWSLLTFHDSPYLVTRAASQPFDRFLELLGGAGVQEEAGRGLLFPAEGSGIDAVEVMALKTAAFLQVVAALRRHYGLLGRPHLDLHPGQIVAEPGPAADLLPHRWSFRVKLRGAAPRRVARLAPTLEVPLPPRAPRAPFASPALRAARLARPSTGELLVERVVEEKKGKGLWRIEASLLDPHGFYPAPGPRDWFQLAWPAELLGRGRTAVARLDPRTSADSVQMAITTEPLELDEEQARRLGRAGGFRVAGVRYRIYPALSIPEDLHALGVLLLRILLVNDGQPVCALEPLIEPFQMPEGRGRRSPEEYLAALLASEPQKLAKSNLFHGAGDRGPGRPNAVPEEVWNQALLLAFRLIARGPGLGLEAERGGGYSYDEALPATHLDPLRAEAEDILRQLQALLFERQPVHLEIRAVIEELLSELGDPTGLGTSPQA